MAQKRDNNTLIGLLLIGAILIWFTMSNKSEEAVDTNQPAKQEQSTSPTSPDVANPASTETEQVSEEELALPDSIRTLRNKQKYGLFALSQLSNKAEEISLENEVIKLRFNTKGGQLLSAELKEYVTYDTLPLILFDEDSSQLSYRFWSAGRTYDTRDLTFEPLISTANGDQLLTMKLKTDDGAAFQIQYTLKKDAYSLNATLSSTGMEEYIVPNSDLNMEWQMRAPKLERSAKSQGDNSTVYYYDSEGEYDYLNERKDDAEELKLIDWVGFKNQFFVVVIDPEKPFERADIETKVVTGSDKYVKEFYLSGDQLIETSDQLASIDLYFLPNHFNTLKEYDKGFEKMVPLGWAIFRWINRGIVIPTFNLLDGWGWGYGVIILVMALLIKLILFPLTYKSYMSMAKMRVLKPEVDAISEKHKDPMKKQQAMMDLYRKAGANPIGGCLPMLLQMPILIAMFRFFPSSFELRQESFLWATDLSTYDSIWDFGYVPILNTLYGDHVSLFTILMTISTLIYTHMNQQMTMGGGAQMKQMKVMMYLMPIMFLGFFNNYAAGLSYYYFVSNIITFSQQWIIRKRVDDNKILAKMEENKKKPKKKSKFQQRLEEAAKQRGQQFPKR